MTVFNIEDKVVRTAESAESELLIQRGKLDAGIYIFRLENTKTGSSSTGKIAILYYTI